MSDYIEGNEGITPRILNTHTKYEVSASRSGHFTIVVRAPLNLTIV